MADLSHDQDVSQRDVARPVLVVDLDDTLLRSDMLYETFWAAFSENARSFWGCLAALRSGRPALKAYLAEAAGLDVGTLPYDDRVLERVRRWREAGGRTALVTATDQGLADRVAAHLGVFDEVHGTGEGRNLKGAAKAAFLRERFAREGYAYFGDSAADLPVWAGAREAVSIGASPAVRRALDRLDIPAEHLPPRHPRGAAIWQAIRPHQWLKNVLVLIPLIASQSFSTSAILATLLAFAALSLAASAGYLVNDLLDLADDRSHPRKRNRPIASGALSARSATRLAPLMLLLAGLAGLAVSATLAIVVTIYFIGTMAYSVKLKRHNMVDICMLAFLFTLRIIAGGVAIAVPPSMWLLAFSIFIFLSLAAIKRLAELTDRESAARAVSRRGYRVEDRPILSQVALSSGYLAVLVFALYINEPIVQNNFGQPVILWGVCPLLLFWVSRLSLVAARGEMHDDPMIFALRNRTSRKVLVLLTLVCTLAALL